LQTDERAVGAGAAFAVLEALVGLARITAEELDTAAALDAFSEAMARVIPHDWVNVAYLEPDGRRFHLLGTFLSRPGEPQAAHYTAEVATDGSPFRHTLRTGEPRVVHDYPNDPLWAQAEPQVRALVEQLGLRAGLGVPLRLRGRVIGALIFASRQPGCYGAEHVQLAQRFADYLAPFVENLRLYAIERQQRAQLAARHAITQALVASLEVAEVFPVFAEAARALVPHDRVGVALLSDDGTALERLAVAAHDQRQVTWGDRVRLRDTGLRVVIERDQGLWCADAQHDPRVALPHDRAAVRREGIRSAICVPLRAKGRAFGVLTFACAEPNRYSEQALHAAQQIADQIAPFLDNVRLYRQVRTLAAAEERNRLAREVHDTLVQGLVAIALQLDAAEALLPPDAPATPRVIRARELTRRALAEARRAVQGLPPSALEHCTLREALEAEVGEFRQRTGLAATFTCRGRLPPLDAQRAAALLRIAQEALHNVEKHAAAQRVRVLLAARTRPPGVLLRVEDDGRGFDPRRLRPAGDGGYGLAGMRERARLAGGTLIVQSRPGAGTRLIARLPVPPPTALPPPADAAGAAQRR
jgi:signal transduction histidine kinase